MRRALNRLRSNWRVVSATLLVLILLLAAALLTRQAQQVLEAPTLTANEPPPAVVVNDAAPLVQTLYRLEAQAAQDGWTNAAHRQAGDILYRLGDVRGAVARWEAAGPVDAAAARRLAQAYIDLEDWSPAVEALHDIIDQRPDDPWANFHLGTILAIYEPHSAQLPLATAAEADGYSERASKLLDVLREHENDLTRPMYIGAALSDLELWSQAESAFEYAAVVAHPYPEAVASVALTRVYQGKAAQTWMDDALSLGPREAQVHYLHGLYTRALGENETSRQAFAEAVRLDPTLPVYYAELGTAHRLVSDYETAEHWLRTAVNMQPDNPDLRQRLAVFYAQEGYRFSPQHVDTLQDTRSSLPLDPDLIAGFAWTLYAVGETQAALNELETALALAPENAQALYNKARISIDTGELEQGKALLRRVDPTSMYAEPAESLLAAVESLPTPEMTPEVTPDTTPDE